MLLEDFIHNTHHIILIYNMTICETVYVYTHTHTLFASKCKVGLILNFLHNFRR